MVRTDETSLICDFAETYNITDYRALSLKTAAALASGLSEDSRIKMRITGQRITTKTALLAGILDRLTTLVWMQTQDGHKGRNRPESILAKLTKDPEPEKKDDFLVFESSDAFNTMWNRLTAKEKEEDADGSG
jgi:hypothetical protein